MDTIATNFSCIKYIPNNKEISIRGSRVSLTKFEDIFINYLIENEGYCNLSSFLPHLSASYKRALCRRCSVVYINRLRKKIYTQTGDKFIRCKYGFGYYIP